MVFALLGGAVLGLFWMTIAPLAALTPGLKRVPRLLLLSWTTVVVPVTFGEAIGLNLKAKMDSPRPYLYVQIFCGATCPVASLFLLSLGELFEANLDITLDELIIRGPNPWAEPT